MIAGLLSRIDWMVRLLLLAILCASFIPVEGSARDIAQGISDGAIFLLFLLNGMRLSRADVLAGLGNWRFLGALVAWCYGAMALAGLALFHLGAGILPGVVALGFLYLGTLSSTVQSATAYSSLAGGNVAYSVVAAALLNIIGVFLTAPLFSLLAGQQGFDLGGAALVKILLILILPFVLGQIIQSRTKDWMDRNSGIVGWMDRFAIATAVYVAFSGAVTQGLWTRVDPSAWVVLLGGVVLFLAFGFYGAWVLSARLQLARPARIAFLFAGAHKSTAMGAPLAMVLFPPATAGLLMVPLLAYHLLQLIISAPLANRLRSRSD
ncbi:bile acid:sodium symporter [Altererythrobacter sp. SALINAS58]|uniref:bile acid:sodium symporter family protein n=1 Tax=Alteripontixanthobacter muriae TaxID=2705546 RepID=UPI001574FA8F|nr:bile acid:sodium symporter family protein [Alteripontixanthobacter muriae]NTZ41562.1 bile acid:sodium symporter [Alteripontixanthobacter muriae]